MPAFLEGGQVKSGTPQKLPISMPDWKKIAVCMPDQGKVATYIRDGGGELHAFVAGRK